MPLEVYRRGKVWWVRGYVEIDGLRISGYYRQSTRATSEAGAKRWAKEETDRQIRRYFVGGEAEITFSDAVMLYNAKSNEAKFLIPILDELGDTPISQITPKVIRNLGPKLYHNCATDTWVRQVISPTRAVINNAHDLGKCPPIRVKLYTAHERLAQDVKRGKQSRVEREPATREWVEKFCEHADAYNAAIVQFAFENGARIGQIVEIEPRHLDLMKSRVWMPESKGHQAQWVSISQRMVVTLANLPPRTPRSSKTGKRLGARVFGYADRTGMIGRWKTICKAAGINYLSPHPAGRHAFYTEMRVGQGMDPITVAKAGRWKDPTLPDKTYAHSLADEVEIRERASTGRVQGDHDEVINQLNRKEK